MSSEPRLLEDRWFWRPSVQLATIANNTDLCTRQLPRDRPSVFSAQKQRELRDVVEVSATARRSFFPSV